MICGRLTPASANNDYKQFNQYFYLLSLLLYRTGSGMALYRGYKFIATSLYTNNKENTGS
ncbi:hypothetical protein [Neobacillus drentensis]|uniref:hypothetical protein n=1 Tax=Neobacillus drentensis TaxID=220684 RepID=UPI002FFEF8EA